MSIKPEDILADGVDTVRLGDISARKGTVAAVLANISIIEDSDVSTAERDAAWQLIKDHMPTLIALDFHRYVTWKNPDVQALMESDIGAGLSVKP